MPFSDTKTIKDIVYGPDLAKIDVYVPGRIFGTESPSVVVFLLRR